MANPSIHQGDLHVAGALTMQTITIPANSVGDTQIPALANISAAKFRHRHTATVADNDGVSSSDQTTKVTHVRGTTGTLIAIEVSCSAAPIGDATHTFDVHVGGVTKLTGVITLTNASVADTIYTGTFSATTLADGNIVEIVQNATIGTGTLPTGVAATLTWEEDGV